MSSSPENINLYIPSLSPFRISPAPLHHVIPILSFGAPLFLSCTPEATRLPSSPVEAPWKCQCHGQECCDFFFLFFFFLVRTALNEYSPHRINEHLGYLRAIAARYFVCIRRRGIMASSGDWVVTCQWRVQQPAAFLVDWINELEKQNGDKHKRARFACLNRLVRVAVSSSLFR